MKSFLQLGLRADLLQAVQDLGFDSPSEIQEKAIPELLKNDRDFIALAQTGTGKTAAFGFPLLQHLEVGNNSVQGVILTPTRELCLQITNELNLYGKYLPNLRVTAIYGGASIQDQTRQIQRGSQVIVATPGRMKDMISRGIIDISDLRFSILDEADEMLNMGFYEDITFILSGTPAEKRTWLFSATMPKEVARLAKDFLNNPAEISIGTKNVSTNQVSHEYYPVSTHHKYQALKRLVDVDPSIFAVVFCRTKRETQKIADNLSQDGYNAAPLHGDLSQNHRDQVMKSFRSKQIQLLVATDIAARGIDVDDITHVIHYQLPDEPEVYNHRSGRTGRAGKTGISIVIANKGDQKKLSAISKSINKKFEQKTIPTAVEICENQLLHLARNVHDTDVNPEIENYLYAINEILGDVSKDELIKKFFSVEFSRFHDYYKGLADISSSSHGDDGTRFFINIGQKDGFDWTEMKDLLKELLSFGDDEVYQVDVKETFSFFNTPSSKANKVLEVFQDIVLEGRKINVEVTKDRKEGRSGGGRSSGSGGRNNRSSSSRRKGGGGYSNRQGSSSSDGGHPKRTRNKRKPGGGKPDTRPSRVKNRAN